jgi:regulator of protease activity HflC (stomatin/prohibitin superfamily)
MEKTLKPMSGYFALILGIVLLALAVFFMVTQGKEGNGTYVILAVVSLLLAIFFLKGIVVVSPNHSRVLTFFGKYVGTVKENGLLFINPFFTRQKISLRAENLESAKLKVNDKLGNPIEIAAVIVWQVKDTYKAAFEVEAYMQYVKVQSEASVRHLAMIYPYDSMEADHETKPDSITLREGGEKVNAMLESELNDRLAPSGIHVLEARISHLAYAPEIAGAVLQRQQATAIVAARAKIVEGAVGMVEMALDMLSCKEIVQLDEEKKAAMVSNLLVVLCGEKAATPVLNAGTLYQ